MATLRGGLWTNPAGRTCLRRLLCLRIPTDAYWKSAREYSRSFGGWPGLAARAACSWHLAIYLGLGLRGDTSIEVRAQAVRLKPRPLAAVRLALAL